MYKAFELFRKNVESAKYLTSLYQYLENSITSPLSFEDLLRAQIVYSVSAFDKLIHDFVRIGMVEIFVEKRRPTAKYLSESISIATYNEMITATIPPKEYIFEQAIFQKFKTVSFQTPEKVAEGLSYIWEEKQKWQKIALQMNMGLDDKKAKNTLKLIANRRNSIVHEADINPLTEEKYSITCEECEEITLFIESCGRAILELIL